MTAGRVTFLLLLCLGSRAYAADAPLPPRKFFPEPLPASSDSPDSSPPRAPQSAEAAAEQPLQRPTQEVLNAVSRRLAEFAETLAAEGYRSQALIEHLASLADLYQELGDHYPAVGALDWALELSRIHRGLHSIEHAALLERMIESVTAVKEYGEAAALEQRLLEVTYRNLQDPRVPLILAASADRRLRQMYRLLEENDAGRVVIHVGVSGDPAAGGDLPSEQRREALRLLWSARQQYADAILAGVRNGRYALLDLLELEERLLATYFLEMSHPDLAPPPEQSGWLCASGEAVLENSVGNVARIRQSSTAVAGTLVKLADWRLLCSRNGRALDTYSSAYATLADDERTAGTIAQLLSPEVPAALPAFRDPPDDDGGEHPYRGYVDVSFVVGKYGSARNIEILGSSPGTSKATEKELKTYIAGNRFRPRMLDGALARADRVEVRYYYR